MRKKLLIISCLIFIVLFIGCQKNPDWQTHKNELGGLSISKMDIKLSKLKTFYLLKL